MSKLLDLSGVSRRTLLQAGAGLAGGALLPSASAARPSRSAPPTSRRSAPGRTAPRATRSTSAPPCRAPAPTRCRARTSSRAGSSRSSTSTTAIRCSRRSRRRSPRACSARRSTCSSADSAAKPNQAVQEQQTFINQNKIVADDRLDLVGGRGRAQQVRAAREGALRHRHFRLERHHRQGLRALRLPPELLRRDRGQRDRPGAGQGLRQEQEGGVHDAGLHLRPHRHQVGERLPDQERRLDAW